MDTEGTVAIITRTKSRPLFLERAMQSVLNQTYPKWRMVVINDGGDIAAVNELAERFRERFAGRLLVLHNEASQGMEAASNRGIGNSESEYVVIHDDDDTWAPAFLAMCVHELEATRKRLPSVMGVITDSRAVFERIERGTIVVERTEPYIHRNPSGLLSFFDMAKRNRFPPIAFVYRREVLEQIGLYNASLPVMGDWDFNLRFMARYDILTLAYPLANYHLRPSSTGVAGNSTMAGISQHVIYDQYLRNALLRSVGDEAAARLGFVVNVAQQFELLQDAIRQLPTVQSGNGLVYAPRAGEPVGDNPGSSALLWIIVSTFNFLRSQDKGGLIAKFMKHWRTEGSRRAITVVARWGFLAAGER